MNARALFGLSERREMDNPETGNSSNGYQMDMQWWNNVTLALFGAQLPFPLPRKQIR